MGQVENKVALVTGGASGVGREVVLLLLREGARVLISDVNEAAGQALAAECGENAVFVRHDVTQEADWQAAMALAQQRFGGLDILINNAGILIPGNVETATLAQFQQLMQVNAASVFLGCHYAVAAMKERGGSIVNMASVSSWLPVENYLGYSASKAAVGAITRTTALYCRNQGLSIRVNSVHPGVVESPMMSDILATYSTNTGVSSAELKEGILGQYLVKRFADPREIATSVLYLASDEAAYVTGQVLGLSGGMYM